MLDLARQDGLTTGGLDKLADMGSRLILSFGRQGTKDLIEFDALNFQLTNTEFNQYQTLLNNPNLQQKASLALAEK